MEVENILAKLAFKYGCDKCPKLKHSYTDFYFDAFKDKRNSVHKLLEIGVGAKTDSTTPQYVDGAGLHMWNDFFPKAKIYGIDIQKNLVFKKGRIQTFFCNQSDTIKLAKLIKKIGKDIDIVIDDGSHKPEDMVTTCKTLMSILKKDVIYVIEDTDRNKATYVLENLKEFNCHVVRHSRMKSPDDRLIFVSNEIKNPNIKSSAKVSIIIPSCNEIREVSPGVTVLQKTVQDIYENATGEFEVIVGFNGPSYQDFPNYPNLRIVKLPENIGIKGLINLLSTISKGKYIYKTDAHCKFDKGFDETLKADMEDNWLVTPRFYVLNPDTWEWQDSRHYDYFYLCCPFTDPRGFRFKAGGHWPERTLERENDHNYDIDETPQFHGSGWFVEREFFLNNIGGFPNNDPFGHAQEPPNIGLKYWLGPWSGKVMVNKKTWYAHMHQSNEVKGYHYTHYQEKTSYDIWARYWMADKWGERVHNIDWFIEKFMPMPTWPENWRKLLENWKKGNK